MSETGVGIHATPRRVHCRLTTKALLLTHFGRGLQHHHLMRSDRKTPNLILWGLWAVAALVPLRMTTAPVMAAAVTIKILVLMDRPHLGSDLNVRAMSPNATLAYGPMLYPP